MQVELIIKRHQFLSLVILYVILFNLSYFFKLQPLVQTTSLLFFFFIPGYLLLVNKKMGSIQKLTFSVGLSVIISVVISIIFNLALGLKVNALFLPITISSTILFLLFFAIRGMQNRDLYLKIKPDKLDYIFVIFLVLSIVARLYLFHNTITILGADVGRFTIISQTYILKQGIVANLQPYDLATGYFYFPGPLVFPMLLELSGFDPVIGVTLTVFILDIISLLAFYLLVENFLGRKIATNAFLFYSFLSDILLNLGIFGVFPQSISILYLFLSMIVAYEIFFEKKVDYPLIILTILGFLVFHLYTTFVFLSFVFALITYEIGTGKIENTKRMIKTFTISSLVALLLISPYYLIEFGKYFGINFEADNVADLMVFSYGRSQLPFVERIIQVLFASPVGLRDTVVSFLGLIAMCIAAVKIFRTKAMVFLIFFVYSTLFTWFVFSDYNLFRSVFATWIVYSIAFAVILNKPYLNLLIIPLFFFAQSQATLSLIANLVPIQNPAVPWLLWPKFFDTMNFIKTQVPNNATFLIDGGGVGCTGANPSYGERIFPETSRKIFFFTDYCWAQYNKTEYQNRVNIYRAISINPNDKLALAELKAYNVTYVYIGKYHVGLDPQLFLNSTNYKLIYFDGEDYVFQIL